MDGYRISYGWSNDDLSLTVLKGDSEEVLYETISLQNLCDEPAFHWHRNGKVDQEHYDFISQIADRLDEQAKRLRSVLSSLEVK